MRLTAASIFPGPELGLYVLGENRYIQDVYAAIEEPLHFPLWPEAREPDKRNSRNLFSPGFTLLSLSLPTERVTPPKGPPIVEWLEAGAR